MKKENYITYGKIKHEILHNNFILHGEIKYIKFYKVQL